MTGFLLWIDTLVDDRQSVMTPYVRGQRYFAFSNACAIAYAFEALSKSKGEIETATKIFLTQRTALLASGKNFA